MSRKCIGLILAGAMIAGMLCACSAKPEQTDPVQKAPFFEADPGEDGVLNILAIGAGDTFMDELYGMLADADVNASVTSACCTESNMEQLWSGLTDGSRKYQFVTFHGSGKNTRENLTLEEGLQLQNWDYISLQYHYPPEVSGDYEKALLQIEPHVKNLYGYLGERFPHSRLLWHQTWACQVGYEGPLNQNPATVEDAAKVRTAEKQEACHEVIRQAALTVCRTFGVTRVPCGDAWQLARADARVGDRLCVSLSVNGGMGDNYHDGDIGGGQYLNACVWFEIITGKSCKGSNYRPVAYALTDDKIAGLQESAHRAVAAAE